MPWYFAVIESNHELQNPTSPEKIRLLGDRMRLGSGSRVLDLASGKGGPARILAETYGCQVTCVEKADEFDAVARARARGAGLESLIECVHADAHEYSPPPGEFDAAMCLGASFIWGDLAGTLAALIPAVRSRGFVAVGEPYWRVWPVADRVEAEYQEEYRALPETVDLFRDAGLEPVSIIDASLDDWDRYETLHWLVGEEWLSDHGDDPDADEIGVGIENDRERYLRWQRDLLGWAIIVGRKS